MSRQMDKQEAEGSVYGAGGRADPEAGKKHSILDNRFVMMVTGPIMGLLYVIFMPILALITIVALLGGKLLEGLLALVGRSVSFGWRPASSYLSGKNKEKKNKETK